MTRLDKIEINKYCKVIDIQTQNIQARGRILDMGITPNVVIKVVKNAPFGDPIQVRLRNYNIGIRKADAEGIIVEEIDY